MGLNQPRCVRTSRLAVGLATVPLPTDTTALGPTAVESFWIYARRGRVTIV